jgi:hypothetical protein
MSARGLPLPVAGPGPVAADDTQPRPEVKHVKRSVHLTPQSTPGGPAPALPEAILCVPLGGPGPRSPRGRLRASPAAQRIDTHAPGFRTVQSA